MNKKIVLEFVGVDSWNRPIFKDIEHKKSFYGSTDQLFNYSEVSEIVLETVTAKDITYFGSSFDCEPVGYPVNCEIEFKEKTAQRCA